MSSDVVGAIGESIKNGLAQLIRCKRGWLREFLAEFTGTAFLVCLGNGAVAQAVLSRGSAGSALTIYLAYAMAIAFGVYICAGVSGGHINPAITLAMCTLQRCPWRRLPVYWTGQMLGGFVGSSLLYFAYKDAIDNFDGGVRQVYGENATASIFASYPAEFVTSGTGLFDQVLGSAVLALCVFALTDQNNTDIPKHLVPLLIGLTVGLIGMSYGLNAQFAINPARDLGPRLFTLVAGWGWEVFSFRNYDWFWIPLVGPCIGAVIGAAFYELAIGVHLSSFSFTLETQCNDSRHPGAGIEMFVSNNDCRRNVDTITSGKINL